MMKFFAATMIVLAVLAAEAATGSGLLSIDDSYTVSRRYLAYKDEYPSLKVPELTFKAGQRVLFDRLYKTVGDRELHLDIFLPAPSKRGSRQGVMLVHGGGWRAGEKSEFYAMANLLAQRGYAVFLPEYRRSPEAPYPAGLIDVNDALAWVKAQAGTYGVDRDHIALGGGSSGGQMAALLAYTSNTSLFKTHANDDTRVNALFDLDGVLNFTSPLALQFENAAGDASPAALWLGGSAEHAAGKWREASASVHVDAQSPPTLIISSGAPRFTAGKDEVLAELERHGIRHQYLELVNVPHTFWLFEPHLSKVVGDMDAFLRVVR
jgi:acetyl esterase